jgi:hypothetical protein
MVEEDLKCESCGSDLRQNLMGDCRNWICTNDDCMKSRWVRSGEEDQWSEILPMLQLYYPGEEMSKALLDKFWERMAHGKQESNDGNSGVDLFRVDGDEGDDEDK